MNNLRQIDHLADMAREHQAELLRVSQSSGPRQPALNRVRAGLVVLVVLAVPIAFLFARAW